MSDNRAKVYNEIVKVVNGNKFIDYDSIKNLNSCSRFESLEIEEGCKQSYVDYLKSGEYVDVIKCSIPLLDLFKKELTELDELEGFVNIKEMEDINEAMLNSMQNYDEEELDKLADVLTKLTEIQVKDRSSFIFKYTRDSRRLYRSLKEHVEITILALTKLKPLTDVSALKFMYFLWTEYSTVPSSLGNNALTVYLNEFEVFTRQL